MPQALQEWLGDVFGEAWNTAAGRPAFNAVLDLIRSRPNELQAPRIRGRDPQQVLSPFTWCDATTSELFSEACTT